jgi:hypothetical protein
VPARGIIVHFQITKVNGVAQVDPASFKLLFDSGQPSLINPTLSVDTTDVNGIASRTLLAIPPTFGSVEVQVSASDMRGKALGGSPVTFLLPQKKGP